jgi:hypothetical protein
MVASSVSGNCATLRRPRGFEEPLRRLPQRTRLRRVRSWSDGGGSPRGTSEARHHQWRAASDLLQASHNRYLYGRSLPWSTPGIVIRPSSSPERRVAIASTCRSSGHSHQLTAAEQLAREHVRHALAMRLKLPSGRAWLEVEDQTDRGFFRSPTSRLNC